VTKYWITNRDGYLTAYSKPMTPKSGRFAGLIRDYVCTTGAHHYQALGLPHEIPPGQCWEVSWHTASVTIHPTRQHRTMLVPIARNVTEELKESSRG
jgi:hypothetical protein